MLRVGYKKTEQGPVVVEVEEVGFDGFMRSQSIIERFNRFFHNVPVWGGQEWKTLSTDEIFTFFRTAAVEIRKAYQERYNEAVSAHSRRNVLVRWWKEMRGWAPPVVPTEKMILDDMAERCRNLSGWMRANQYRPFYSGSDMSHLITKPKVVAQMLTPQTDDLSETYNNV